MGPERRSHIVSEKDRKLTAYHESGHAIVAHLLPHANPVHKVTIIPRGYAGGYTMMLPKEEHDYKTKAQLLADIRVALGGRIAEALVLGDISDGRIWRFTKCNEYGTFYGYSLGYERYIGTNCIW